MNVKSFASAALSALLFFSASAAIAQTSYKMGATFGSTYSSLRSDLFTTSSGRLSPAAGFAITLGFGQHFELNPEILVAQKGATIKTVVFNPENAPTDRSYDFNYTTFEAALFAGYAPFANLPISVQAGGFFGSHFHRLDLSQRDQFVGDYDNVVNATPVVNLNEALSGVDFGPAVGLSAGSGKFRFNARYYLGARNLYNNIAFAPEGHQIRTNAIRITLTYFFKDKSTWND
jgi:hypothetical protein